MPVNIPVIKPFLRHYKDGTLSKLPVVRVTATQEAKAWVEYHTVGDFEMTLEDPFNLTVGDKVVFLQLEGSLSVSRSDKTYSFAGSAADCTSTTRAEYKIAADENDNNYWTLVSSSGSASLRIEIGPNSPTFDRTITDEVLNGVKELVYILHSGGTDVERTLFIDVTPQSLGIRITCIHYFTDGWRIRPLNVTKLGMVSTTDRPAAMYMDNGPHTSNATISMMVSYVDVGDTVVIPLSTVGEWKAESTTNRVDPSYYQ